MGKQDDDKTIVEFLGCTLETKGITIKGSGGERREQKLIVYGLLAHVPSWFRRIGVGWSGTKWYILDKVKFDSDWSWLMPVVKKINAIAHEQELYDVGEYELLADYLIGADIDTTYNQVVQFIKWYNLDSSN